MSEMVLRHFLCVWENFSRRIYADLSPVGVPVNQRPQLCIPDWNIILGFKMHHNSCFCSPVIISGEGEVTNSILKCTSWVWRPKVCWCFCSLVGFSTFSGLWCKFLLLFRSTCSVPFLFNRFPPWLKISLTLLLQNRSAKRAEGLKKEGFCIPWILTKRCRVGGGGCCVLVAVGDREALVERSLGCHH